jgi:hypothetical protein
MGIEIFLLVLLAIAGIAAGIFFTGSFGVAKATADDDDEGDRERPAHVYVEEETEAKVFGADSTGRVRENAERDPDTEIRA